MCFLDRNEISSISFLDPCLLSTTDPFWICGYGAVKIRSQVESVLTKVGYALR